ncbi:MAG TPA: hypothetical protein VMY80_02140 [Anaerolineae bacterium]|nr:hypothetical protein [Anaerolineae bacterium]
MAGARQQVARQEAQFCHAHTVQLEEEDLQAGRAGMVGQEGAALNTGPVGELEVQRVEGHEFRLDPIGQFAKERQEMVRIAR